MYNDTGYFWLLYTHKWDIGGIVQDGHRPWPLALTFDLEP